MNASMRKRIVRQAMPWLLSALLLAGWQLASVQSGISHAILPAPKFGAGGQIQPCPELLQPGRHG